MTTSLAAGNERLAAVCKCRVDCLSWSFLELFRNYICLFACKSCGIKYAGEGITPVNLRMNIH